MNVPPLELPRVAWVGGVPATLDRTRAARTTETPGAPTTGIASARELALPGVGPRELPEVARPG